MERKVTKQVQGFRTQDGAGVSLVRVLGTETAKDFDPFIMLDSFDSTDPADYIAGFPPHPHRGLETVTYLAQGAMTHKDNLGSEATITDGEAQWLTAGSGAFHSEMPPAMPRMLGTQLWLNLPKANKFASPAYHSITNDEIQEFPFEGGMLRLVCGDYQGHSGWQGKYLPLDYYDIRLDEGAQITLDVAEDRACMAFTLTGSIRVGDTVVNEKTAALLEDGDTITLVAEGGPAEILFTSSKRLDEPVAMYGPMVMNTMDEIITAIDELQAGTFVKEGPKYMD